MKAKFGAIVVDGRGKVGGHVFAKNRGGNYMRTKVTPVNPQTSFQLTVRARLAQFSSNWRDLSQENRDAWSAAGPEFQRTNVFGDLTTPTGKNLYTSLNQNIASIGGTSIDVPPAAGSIAEPTLTIISQDASVPLLEITVGNLDTTQSYQILATAQQSPGVDTAGSKFRQIVAMTGSEIQPFSIVSQYVAKFGGLVSGKKIFFKAVPIITATGQAGVGATASGINVG